MDEAIQFGYMELWESHGAVVIIRGERDGLIFFLDRKISIEHANLGESTTTRSLFLAE